MRNNEMLQSKFGFIKVMDRINEIYMIEEEQVNKIKFQKFDTMHNKKLNRSDAEILAIIQRVGNYFLEYAVDGQAKNYVELDEIKGNF